MWSLIRANQRRSLVLILTQGLILLAGGYAMGFFIGEGAEFFGVIAALGLWLILLLAALTGGERILLAQAGAREIAHKDAPRLYNVVEEMQLAAGLPKTPRVFIVDSPVPNAFAVGLTPERAAVAVTTGLLSKLNRDELQGVVAHEIAHIANRDTRFMTLAGVTLGAIVMLADLFLRGLRHGSRIDRRYAGKGKNQGAIILLVLALVLAILAPLLARLLYFACSRRREFLADACGAQFTRYPEGLASALEKISGGQVRGADASRVLRPMYIVSPLAADDGAGLGGWLSTHPPLRKRVAILRGMTGDASLLNYERAFEQEFRQPLVAPAALQGLQPVEVRARVENDGLNWREANGILHRAAGLAVLTCTCGLTIKLPPGFTEPSVACPRCGRALAH
jgi:heat shock protein HtpX